MKPFVYNLDFVKKQSEHKLFTVVSMFAGGGGSSTGYKLAGGNVLAVNEFVPAAQEVYHKNYPETPIFGDDIRQLNGQTILDKIGLKKGELDILDGSPPCSSFSTAGKREKDWGKTKKYSDTSQRTDDLFFEFARILNEIQPKVFICENVKGLTMGQSAELLGGEQFSLFEKPKTIFDALVECGYNVRYQVLNAKDYGVPQSRERTIFIGVRKDIRTKITFPRPYGFVINLNEGLEGVVNTEDDIADAMYKEGVVKNYLVQMKEGETGDMYAENGYFGLQRVSRDKPCPTIRARQGNKGACLCHWEEHRELSIPELTRIMSFPEDYYLGDKYSKKAERLGRAVPPLMMKALAEHIYNNILSKIN
jgi:DNA (cytosine-5)-methyltransferase 1